MEIAQRSNDRFGELFHRGVGLLLLAREQERQTPADADPAFAEEMLCKALLALREAKELKPPDARTRAYLAEAYDRCGNRRAAEAERAANQECTCAGRVDGGRTAKLYPSVARSAGSDSLTRKGAKAKRCQSGVSGTLGILADQLLTRGKIH